ncbi:hypothetical protein Q4575_00865 [Psychrosphaera sp. 1_MG-2023]|nr:hypothetical protein [Psychrosphaera sp. 1_MG-2023]MDO6717930.1 hypothetical protein [Psychrosphaera sp. 1_MG-2023]
MHIIVLASFIFAIVGMLLAKYKGLNWLWGFLVGLILGPIAIPLILLKGK